MFFLQPKIFTYQNKISNNFFSNQNFVLVKKNVSQIFFIRKIQGFERIWRWIYTLMYWGKWLLDSVGVGKYACYWKFRGIYCASPFLPRILMLDNKKDARAAMLSWSQVIFSRDGWSQPSKKKLSTKDS